MKTLNKIIFNFYDFMLNPLEKPRLQFSSVRKMSLRSEDKMTPDRGWCCKFLRDWLPSYNFFLSGCIIYTLTFNSWICLPFWTFFPREEGGALWYWFGHKILPNSLEQNCWCQIFFLDDKVFLHCDPICGVFEVVRLWLLGLTYKYEHNKHYKKLYYIVWWIVLKVTNLNCVK